MRFASVLLCLLLPVVVLAQPSPPAEELSDEEITRRAETLASLRRDIGDIEAELRALRDEEQLFVRSLGGQLADVRVTLSDLVRRKEALRRSLNEDAAERRAAGDRSAELREALGTALGGIQRAVDEGLPFQLDARSDAVAVLRANLASGSTPAATVLSEAVRFIEDELRLTEEFGLYTQTIEWEGERQLVDVVRVGMVALFVRAGDGTFGHAVPHAEGWRFEPLPDAASDEQVQRLFGAMGRAVRRGQFELPIARVSE